jgi:hypothetical protein
VPTLPWITPNRPGPQVSTALVMASKLQVRSFKDVPRFFRQSLVAWKQVKTAPGALGASLIAQPLKRTFWTLSAWESREQLYVYARTEPHKTVMTSLRSTMNESVFTFWEVPVDELPINWADARRRLAEQAAADRADPSN